MAKQQPGVLALPAHLLTSVFLAAGAAELPALRLACSCFLRPANEATRSLTLRGAADAKLSHYHSVEEVDASQATGSDSWLEVTLPQACPNVRRLKLGQQRQALAWAGSAALRRLARLQRLDLSGISLSDSTLQRLLAATGGRLTHLVLRECGASPGGITLSDGGLATALGSLPQLQELDLGMCTNLGDGALQRLAASCPHVHKLDLTGCERFSEAGLRQLSALPLRTLVLSACCQLTDACLLAISQSLPQLACLGIFEAGEGVTDAGLAHLAGLAGSLTALDLGYSCWEHTAAGLAALLAQLPRLAMLNIGGCEGARDSVVATLAERCTQLTRLDLSECQAVSAAGVRHLAKLTRLQELDMGWNIRLRDEALQGLPPSLTKVDLSFCGGLSNAALEHLAALPTLASCSLRKCGGITDAGMHQLARCSSLRHLDLSYTTLSAAGLRALAALPGLSSLVLVDCLRLVQPPSMKLLGEALTALRSLDLSNNRRLDDGCMQALSHTSRLRSLRLDCCPRVSDRGLLELCRATGLRQLSIHRCPQIGGEALARLQRKRVLLRVAAQPAGAALERC